MDQTALQLPTKEQFLEQVDTTFRATSPDGSTFDLHYFKLDPKISNSVQEAFSLLFRAPLDIVPEQGNFHIEHDALGGFDLFMVPVKQKEDALIFEAVFNLLLV